MHSTVLVYAKGWLLSTDSPDCYVIGKSLPSIGPLPDANGDHVPVVKKPACMHGMWEFLSQTSGIWVKTTLYRSKYMENFKKYY